MWAGLQEASRLLEKNVGGQPTPCFVSIGGTPAFSVLMEYLLAPAVPTIPLASGVFSGRLDLKIGWHGACPLPGKPVSGGKVLFSILHETGLLCL